MKLWILPQHLGLDPRQQACKEVSDGRRGQQVGSGILAGSECPQDRRDSGRGEGFIHLRKKCIRAKGSDCATAEGDIPAHRPTPSKPSDCTL